MWLLQTPPAQLGVGPVLGWIHQLGSLPASRSVWCCRQRKNCFPDINDSRRPIFAFYCNSTLKHSTSTPNRAHLAADRNDKYFFFLQDSVCIDERWPWPFHHGPVAPRQPSLSPGVCCNVSCFPSTNKNPVLVFCPYHLQKHSLQCGRVWRVQI